MTLAVGDKLPDVRFSVAGESLPEMVSMQSISADKKLVLFGVPGAFTRTCSAAHIPSFIRTADAFRAKGVDHIVCISVNDPWVMSAWGESTGATAAGIKLLADGDSSFTTAAGLAFSAPEVGFIDRCVRFAAYAEDGVVKVINFESKARTCDLTAGETLLDQI